MGYDPVGELYTGSPNASVDPVAMQAAVEEDEALKRQRQYEQQQQQELAVQEQEAQVQQEQQAQEGGGIPFDELPAVEALKAGVGGLVEFADDTIEGVGKLVGQEWEGFPDDWVPANKTGWGKALRSIVSFVGPTVGISSLTKAGILKLGQFANLGKVGKFGDFLGTAAVDMAAGTAVDAINRNSEDDNLVRTLKDNVPDLVRFLPDDWATLDSDSPDVKREKNIWEGAGLGLLGSVVEGLISFRWALRGKSSATEFIPKDEVAKKGLQEITNKSPVTQSEHPILDRILKDETYRQNHIDEMAEVELNGFGGIEKVNEFSPNLHSQVADDIETIPRAVRPDGLAQAMVDNVRIQKNIGTVDGRMSEFMTDSAVKSLGFDDVEGRTLIKKIEKGIKKLGNFEAKLPNGRMMNNKEIMDAGADLAAKILDPKLTGKDLYKLFDDFDLRDIKTVSDGVRIAPLTDPARVQAEVALKELRSMYLNMDTARASAYFQASQAGDIADMATAARVMGEEVDVSYVQQRILEKMEALWYETELNQSVAGWALQNQKVMKDLKKSADPKAIKKFAESAKFDIKTKVRQKAEQKKLFFNELKNLNASNPKFVQPLMMAYDLTNGEVNSLKKLTDYMNQSLGVVNKAFIDGNPEIPSQVVQGLFSTFYNLKLSSLLTPVRALTNNFALLLMKPANVALGALRRGDMKTMHRAWVQYATHMDTTMKAAGTYMGDMFRRIAADPSLTQRADFITQNKQAIEVARAYADAQVAKGNYGPAMKVNFVEAMQAFNNWPWVRYSMNFMEAGDAFVKSAVGMSEARGRAFDQLLKEGKKITPDAIEKASQKIYSEMFDANGLMTDSAALYASREISMNLDNELADGLNQMLQKAPMLKTLVMFPRTSTNVLTFVHKHSPLSYFAGEVAKVNRLTEPDEIASYLATKGVEYTEGAWAAHKAEVRGRVAMGTMLVTMGGWMYASGNLTGNGNYDKQTAKFQQNVGERPLRSWKGPDGKWRSYDSVEPVSSFLALISDIMENINTLGSTKSEDLLRKVGYAFSMNILNKSFLQGLQPIAEMASGQPAALSRWAANTASVGILTQMSRIMQPGLREVSTELNEMLANKWQILGTNLPDKVDFIDGSVVGKEDPVTNLFNNLLPFKTSSNPSPIKEFLINTEFDVQPQLKSSIKGVEYDSEQRSRLSQIMADQGYFRTGLEKLMKDPKVKEDLKMYQELRDKNVESTQADLSNSYTHIQMRRLLNKSVNAAKRQLAREIPDIRLEELKALKTKNAQKKRNTQQILNLQNK